MSNPVDQEEHLAARIAWLYYQEGYTQEAIARQMSISRARVNRIIGEARETGLISVVLNYRFPECVAIEDELRNRYGLEDVGVVPTAADPDRLIRQIGALAAAELDRMLSDHQTLALGWGRTIAAVAQSLPRRQGRGNTVVSLFGGTPLGNALNPNDLTARFGEILDARRYYLNAPMFLDSIELRDQLCREPAIRRVLERIAGADFALLSVTDLGEDSKSRVFGLIDEETRRSLLEAGAVGECAGIYLDAAGQPVTHQISRHMIGAELEVLRALPRVMLASGGLQKVGVLRACLAAGLGNVLVTDLETARALIQ